MRFAVFLLLAVSLAGNAQEWPRQKPIQFVVGFAPGSTTDIVARLVQPRLTEALGQTVVVENRPGAGGNVAAQAVKRAAPDGYTVLVVSVAFAVNPSLYASAGYAAADFVAMALGPSTPNIITVNPAVPQVKAGRVRAIAVTSAQRSPALPEVPTVNEQGFSDFDDLTWIGFFVPAGTSPAVVARLNAEVNRAFEAPDTRERLAQQGLEWKRNTPAEFAVFLRGEIVKWARAVKESGAKAD